MTENKEKLHISVLLQELVNGISIDNKKKNVIVDCTLWMWWHASEILKKLNKWDIFIWFDADKRNLEIVKPRLEEEARNFWVKFFFVNDNFWNLKKRLEEIWIEKITWIYYDLWLSSLHIDFPERWFSFSKDWPLDMRFDINSWITAKEIVNSYKKEDLIRIFKEYGEEPLSKKIAEKIFEERKKWNKFSTTIELANLIWTISNYPVTKARIFQALRIEVNKELEVLEKSLKDAIELLETWWNIFVISFHSLEDRIVKNIFRDETRDCICNELKCICNHKKTLKLLTKKPITPTQEEIKANSRARSAKARLAQKI
jgi:16S rRNA (cytosine1402-N4)-methyltransferase